MWACSDDGATRRIQYNNSKMARQITVKLVPPIKAEFAKSASRTSECPKISVPEFAFIGRSNVGKSSLINEIYSYWPLFLLVLLGGQLGNYLNLKIFPAKMLALVTSALVIFVAIRMGLKLFA